MEKNIVLGSLLGDSFAMPAHWIYDQDEIKRKFGVIDKLLDPPAGSYHKDRKKGEFTHYGDQVVALLESASAKKGFDPEDFMARWQKLFSDYDGYHDHATKETLANIRSGKKQTEAASNSGDFSAAARIAPLVYFIQDLDRLIFAARAQARLTHFNNKVLDASEFMARLCYGIQNGIALEAAIKDSAKNSISAYIEKGLKSADSDTRRFIGEGQSCSLEDALPAIVHLIVKYKDDFRKAMIENVMSGGDSAARGLAVGMVLGAKGTMLPDWKLAKEKYIESLISS